MQSDSTVPFTSLITMEPDSGISGLNPTELHSIEIAKPSNGTSYDHRGRFPYDVMRSPEQEQKIEAFRQVLERQSDLSSFPRLIERRPI